MHALGTLETEVLAGAKGQQRYGVPVTIGRYEIGAPLGRGGLGLVHRALDPELGREVALKLVRPDRTAGDSGARLQARLRREARALARLAHPNVVPVFDVGEANGQVYVVMQLIEGQTLRAWARAKPRRIAEILAIFRQAGEGLAAAHGVGVVHRDFKPDNVLIDPAGHAFVVDFGLASGPGTGIASEPDAEISIAGSTEDDDERLTQPGFVMGTRGFIAPEQRRGEEATPRSDQFAFSVALHEALYGAMPGVRPPSAFAGEPVPDWLAQIVARGRDIEPTRRFATMGSLLAALAKGPTRTRRRVAVLATGTIVAFGLGAWHVVTPQAPCRPNAPPIADAWNDAARDRLHAALRGSKIADPDTMHDRFATQITTRVDDWNSTYAAACTRALADGPAGDPRWSAARQCLRERHDELFALVDVLVADPAPTIVHDAVVAITEIDRADACDDDAWLARHPVRATDPDLRDIRRRLWQARALRTAGRYAQGLTVAWSIVDEAERIDRPDLLAAARIEIGRLAEANGDPRYAEYLTSQAYYLAIEADADEPALDAATRLVHLVGTRLRRDDDALRWAEIAKQILARQRLDATPAAVPVHDALGNAHRLAGRLAEAEAEHRSAIAIATAALGESHPLVATVHESLGAVHAAQGRFADAEASYELALAIYREWLGESHPTFAWALGDLAAMQESRGRYDESERNLLRAIELAERHVGSDHVDVAGMRYNLARVYTIKGQYDEAERMYQRALDSRRAMLGADHPEVAAVLQGLGNVYRMLHRYDEAEQTLTAALTILQLQAGPDDARVSQVLQNLASMHLEAGRPERARELLERAIELRERAFGPEHAELGHAWGNLGGIFISLQDPQGAERAYDKAVAILERWHGPDELILSYAYLGRSVARETGGRPHDALEDAERALRIREASGAAQWLVAGCQQQLAVVLWKIGRDPKRAKALAHAALETFASGGEQTAKMYETFAPWVEMMDAAK